MPPRLRCLRRLQPSQCSSSHSVRSFHSSSRNHLPTPLYPHQNRTGRARSKYNLQRGSQSADDPYKWSSKSALSSPIFSPVPDKAWEINSEQNMMNQIRVNPLGINKQDTPNQHELAKLKEWNRRHGEPIGGCNILFV
jgi:hypothetical protein